MDFELKSLSAAQAAQSALDALIVLVPDDLKSCERRRPFDRPRQGRLAPGGSGNRRGQVSVCLSGPGYQGRTAGACARGRWRCGRSAQGGDCGTCSGQGSWRQEGGHPFVPCWPTTRPGVRTVMTAMSEASYSYVTTKPSAKAREIKEVLLGVRDAATAKDSLRMGQALVTGVELAKEWANRPANHSTPSQLADVARKLGRKPRIKTEVLGPKEVAALGMGRFHGGGARLCPAAALHRHAVPRRSQEQCTCRAGRQRHHVRQPVESRSSRPRRWTR